MSKVVFFSQHARWDGSEVTTNVFAVETGHLSAQALIEYREFLELVYQSPVHV
jgi:hypothetical protein